MECEEVVSAGSARSSKTATTSFCSTESAAPVMQFSRLPMYLLKSLSEIIWFASSPYYIFSEKFTAWKCKNTWKTPTRISSKQPPNWKYSAIVWTVFVTNSLTWSQLSAFAECISIPINTSGVSIKCPGDDGGEGVWNNIETIHAVFDGPTFVPQIW